jgi:hypothetical protein
MSENTIIECGTERGVRESQRQKQPISVINQAPNCPRGHSYYAYRVGLRVLRLLSVMQSRQYCGWGGSKPLNPSKPTYFVCVMKGKMKFGPPAGHATLDTVGLPSVRKVMDGYRRLWKVNLKLATSVNVVCNLSLDLAGYSLQL